MTQYWIFLFEGYDNAFAPITIGKKVQIGVNCFLYPGIQIGDDCIVSSNSSVVSSFVVI